MKRRSDSRGGRSPFISSAAWNSEIPLILSFCSIASTFNLQFPLPQLKMVVRTRL